MESLLAADHQPQEGAHMLSNQTLHRERSCSENPTSNNKPIIIPDTMKNKNLAVSFKNIQRRAISDSGR